MPITAAQLQAEVSANIEPLKKSMIQADAAVQSVTGSFEKLDSTAEKSLNDVGRNADSAKTHVSALSSIVANLATNFTHMHSAKDRLENLSSSIHEAHGNFNKLASSGVAQQLGQSLTIAGVAGSAALGEFARTAATYDQNLRNVDAVAKLTQKQFADLHDGLLALAKDPNVRQSPNDLAEGMYRVYSAGFRGAKAMEVMRWSALGASAGMTTAASSSKALVGVLNSGITGFNGARQAMDIMLREVDNGQNTFEELASSIGTVLPTAFKLHASLQDLTSAESVLTDNSVNLAESNIYIGQMMQEILKPTAQAQHLFQKLGVEYGSTALKGKPMLEYFDNLNAKVEHFVKMHKTMHVVSREGSQGRVVPIRNTTDVYQQLFTGHQAGSAAAILTRGHGKMWKDLYKGAKEASDGIGATMLALNRQNMGARAQIEIFRKQVEITAIVLGEKLLPALLPIVNGIGDMVQSFSNLPDPMQKAIVYGGLVAAILLTITGAVVTVGAQISTISVALEAAGITFTEVAATIGAIMWPIALVGAGIALLAVAWTRDWGHIREYTASFISWISPYLRTAWTEIVSVATTIWNSLVSVVKVIWADILVVLTEAESEIKRNIKGLVKTFLILEDTWNWLRKQFSIFTHYIQKEWSTFTNFLQKEWDLAVSKIRDLVNTLSDKFKWLLGPMNDVKNGVTSVWTDMTTAIKSAISEVMSSLGIFGTEISSWWDTLPFIKYLNSKDKQATNLVNGAISSLAAAGVAKLSGGPSVGGAIPSSMFDANADATGSGIASKALEENMNGIFSKYVHHCQELARVTVEQSTHAMDSLWDRGNNSSAVSNINKFIKLHLAHVLDATSVLRPGDLMYSKTLGHGAGHVQTVGANGDRYDQYGKNHFSMKDFQYYVRPSEIAQNQNLATLTNYNFDPKELSALTAAQNADKQPKHHKKTDAEKLGDKYSSQIESIQKEIALLNATPVTIGGKIVENSKQASVAFDILHGSLKGISATLAKHIINLARYDDALRIGKDLSKDYAKKLIDLEQAHKLNANATDIEKTQYEFAHSNLKALTQALDKHDAALTKHLQLQQQHIIFLMQENALKSMLDNLYSTHLVNSMSPEKQRMINDAGGINVWKDLNDAGKNKYQSKWQSDQKASQGTSFTTEMSDSATTAIRQLAVLQGSVNPLLAKWHEYLQSHKEFAQSISHSAKAASDAYAQFTRTTKKEMLDGLATLNKSITDNVTEQINTLQLKMSRMYDPATRSGVQWMQQNKEIISSARKVFNPTIVDTWTNSVKKGLDTVYDMNEQLKGIDQYSNALGAIIKNASMLKEADPFQRWLISIKKFNLEAKGGPALELPKGLPVESELKKLYAMQQQSVTMKKILTLQDQMKANADELSNKDPFEKWLVRLKVISELTQSLSTVISHSVGAALLPNKSELPSLQSNVMGLEFQKSQVQVQQSEAERQGWKSNPYARQVTLIQQQIDIANNKIRAMGGGLDSLLTRLWGGLSQGVEQTIAKIGQDYLQKYMSNMIEKTLQKLIPSGANVAETITATILRTASVGLETAAVSFGTVVSTQFVPAIVQMNGAANNLIAAAQSLQTNGASGAAGGGSATSNAGSIIGLISGLIPHATGGDILGGHAATYNPGEELIIPKRTSTVFTRNDLNKLASSGGGEIHFHMNYNIHTPNPDAFRRTQQQTLVDAKKTADRHFNRTR